MDKILDRNPSKSEVIGGDEKTNDHAELIQSNAKNKATYRYSILLNQKNCRTWNLHLHHGPERVGLDAGLVELLNSVMYVSCFGIIIRWAGWVQIRDNFRALNDSTPAFLIFCHFSCRNYSMLAFCGVTSVSQVVRILFKAVVFYKAVKAFRDCVEEFYSQAFRVFHHLNHNTDQGLYQFLF